MSEAAPQAANGMTPAQIAEAVIWLETFYSGKYERFGYDADKREWWAATEGVGELLTADRPIELAEKINESEGWGR